MRTAVITGVAGQDGAYLCRHLIHGGDRVVGLKLPGPVPDELTPFLEGVEIHDVDVTDSGALRAALVSVRPDEIYNLAGLSSVAKSWDDPVTTAEVNAVAVVRLLAVLKEATVDGWAPRLLQASSAEIFGQPERSPQDEFTPLRPTSPYGLAKAYAHQSVGLARRTQQLHASTVILYNHESPLRPDSFVTRKVTKAAAAISLGLQHELLLGSLDVSRDWGFAGDYVDAMIRAVRHDVPDDYVIATGEAHSLSELVEAAFAAAGITDWRAHVKTDQAFVRPAEIATMVGDPSHAKRTLGWAPRVSFAELVSAMVAHDLEALGPV